MLNGSFLGMDDQKYDDVSKKWIAAVFPLQTGISWRFDGFLQRNVAPTFWGYVRFVNGGEPKAVPLYTRNMMIKWGTFFYSHKPKGSWYLLVGWFKVQRTNLGLKQAATTSNHGIAGTPRWSLQDPYLSKCTNSFMPPAAVSFFLGFMGCVIGPRSPAAKMGPTGRPGPFGGSRLGTRMANLT